MATRKTSSSRTASKKTFNPLGEMLALAAQGLAELDKEGGGTKEYEIRTAPVEHPRKETTQVQGKVTLQKQIKNGRCVATIKIVDFQATIRG